MSPAALLALLDELQIAYVRHDHPPVFTVAEAESGREIIPGAHSKNLFLRNRKGTAHYLVVAEQHEKIDLRRLADFLGETRLSFGSPPRLLRHLGVTPGSVTPFALINDPGRNDPERGVRVLLSRWLLQQPRLNFHPNVNTSTLTVSAADLRRFLDHCGQRWRAIDLAAI